MAIQNPVTVCGSDPNGDSKAVNSNHGALSVDGTEHLDTTTIEYTADGSGNVAAVALITPASGKFVGIYNICVNTNGGSGSISLDYLTSSVIIARVYPAKRTAFPGCPTHLEGAVDEVVTFEAAGIGAGSLVFVSINHLDH